MENCPSFPFSAAACLCMAPPGLFQRKARGLAAETASFPEQDHNSMLMESCLLWPRQEGNHSLPHPHKSRRVKYTTQSIFLSSEIWESHHQILPSLLCEEVNSFSNTWCNSPKGKKDFSSSLPHLYLKEQQRRCTWGELHGFPKSCSRGHGLTQGLVGAQRLLRAGFP